MGRSEPRRPLRARQHSGRAAEHTGTGMNPAALKERWAALPPRARTAIAIVGPIVLYGLLLQLPGSGSYLDRRAPAGIVAQGIVYGTTYGLGALGLVLIYRANRFINFAHGALGSMVGVLAIGMVLQHGVPYFVAVPIGVAVGVGVGALTEVTIIRRFKDSSRLLLTVSSIGLAQFYGGLELIGATKIHFLVLTG